MDQSNFDQPDHDETPPSPDVAAQNPQPEDTSSVSEATPAAPASDYALVDESTPSTSEGNGSMSIGILIGVVAVLAVLLIIFFGAGGGDSGNGGEGGDGGDGIIVLPTVIPGTPQAIVTATSGANVRTGPGTQYEVVGVLPQGTVAQVVGRSQDGAWWVLNVPAAPNNQGWVSADLVNTQNADNVPIILPPDSGLPAPVIEFTVDSTVIAPGTCTMLRWQTANVSEVYVYPAGERWQDYPVNGNATQEVCPEQTTVYEMRVVLADGSVATRQVQVEVTDAPVEDPLSGTSWQLDSMYTNQLLVPGSSIDIAFKGGEVSGNGGCNNYTGTYTVNGASLVFGPFAVTQRACTEEINQQEQFYLQSLATTSSFESDGSQLILLDAGGQQIARYLNVRDQ